MGFFASRPTPVPADEVEQRVVMPDWFGPPRGVLPGYAPTRAVVFRTDEAILIAGRFDVYRTGVEFTLELQFRNDNDDDFYGVPWERQPHRRRGVRTTDGELPDEFLRLGIVYADGSAWSNVDAVFPDRSAQPTSPSVVPRGGMGDGSRWTANQWLWPLPPNGPLTFVAEWPQHHIAECSATVDATQIRAAVADIEDLWST